ncbi:MAG: ABC transporter substrate-binding protein [Halanaerobiales bacterium]|nr:ABC transporter substrate-binding protein [Halanaerobiales bacterium]
MKFHTKKFTLLFILILVFSLTISSTVFAEKVVTDMAGRKVEVPDEVNKIVTTYRSATQFVFCLGVQDRLAASDLSFEKVSLFQKLYDGEKLPNVGSKNRGINIEQILEVNPDLVILFPHNIGPEVAKKLKDYNIASVIIKPESYEQIKETTRILGKAIGVEERAEKVIDQYDKIIDIVNKREIKDKKKVYFANSELLDTVGKGMLQTSMTELAGGINPAKNVKSGFIKTSLEELLKWNPEYIVVSQYYSGSVQDLLNRPELQELKAIKNENVYRFPSKVEPWDFPSPSSYLGIIWLAEKLYPEKYEDIDVQQVVEEYYNTLYDKSYEDLGGGSL